MPTAHRRPVLLTSRIALWRARYVLAVGGVLLAASVVVRHLAPPEPRSEPVVVAAHDVPAGQVLVAGDLRVVALPPHLVPDGTLTEVDAVGRTAAVTIPRGLAVVESVLAGARFELEPPRGTVVVPVVLTSAGTADLLRVGDLVDLVAPSGHGGYDDLATAPQAPGPAEPEVLARRALVVDVVGAGDEGQGVIGLATGGASEGLTLVAVTPAEGRLLAGETASGPLGAVLVG